MNFVDGSARPLLTLGSRGAARAGLGLLAVILAVGLLTPVDAAAAEYTPGRKWSRGLSNMTLGILALPGHMTKEVRERGWAIGLPVGFGMGLGWTVATEFIGVWEFLSSPFEWPRGFKPIIEPEFPWQYFTELD